MAMTMMPGITNAFGGTIFAQTAEQRLEAPPVPDAANILAAVRYSYLSSRAYGFDNPLYFVPYDAELLMRGDKQHGGLRRNINYNRETELRRSGRYTNYGAFDPEAQAERDRLWRLRQASNPRTWNRYIQQLSAATDDSLVTEAIHGIRQKAKELGMTPDEIDVVIEGVVDQAFNSRDRDAIVPEKMIEYGGPRTKYFARETNSKIEDQIRISEIVDDFHNGVTPVLEAGQSDSVQEQIVSLRILRGEMSEEDFAKISNARVRNDLRSQFMRRQSEQQRVDNLVFRENFDAAIGQAESIGAVTRLGEMLEEEKDDVDEVVYARAKRMLDRRSAEIERNISFAMRDFQRETSRFYTGDELRTANYRALRRAAELETMDADRAYREYRTAFEQEFGVSRLLESYSNALVKIRDLDGREHSENESLKEFSRHALKIIQNLVEHADYAGVILPDEVKEIPEYRMIKPMVLDDGTEIDGIEAPTGLPMIIAEAFDMQMRNIRGYGSDAGDQMTEARAEFMAEMARMANSGFDIRSALEKGENIYRRRSRGIVLDTSKLQAREDFESVINPRSRPTVLTPPRDRFQRQRYMEEMTREIVSFINSATDENGNQVYDGNSEAWRFMLDLALKHQIVHDELMPRIDRALGRMQPGEAEEVFDKLSLLGQQLISPMQGESGVYGAPIFRYINRGDAVDDPQLITLAHLGALDIAFQSGALGHWQGTEARSRFTQLRREIFADRGAQTMSLRSRSEEDWELGKAVIPRSLEAYVATIDSLGEMTGVKLQDVFTVSHIGNQRVIVPKASFKDDPLNSIRVDYVERNREVLQRQYDGIMNSLDPAFQETVRMVAESLDELRDWSGSSMNIHSSSLPVQEATRHAIHELGLDGRGSPSAGRGITDAIRLAILLNYDKHVYELGDVWWHLEDYVSHGMIESGVLPPPNLNHEYWSKDRVYFDGSQMRIAR